MSRFGGVTLVFFLLISPGRSASGPVGAQAQVQAALVERLCRFVEWPEAAFEGADEPFVIGFLGASPLLEALRQVAHEVQVKGRSVEVCHLDDLREILPCHVLWVAAPWDLRAESVIEVARGRPLLTVTDAPGAASHGVHLGLRREGPDLRFDINLAELRASGLRVSPKLLRLGRIVGAPIAVGR